MAALSKCAPAIEAKLGRPLEDRERGQIARQAGSLLNKMQNAGDKAAAEAVLKDFTDRVEAQAIIAKRTAAMNYIKRQAKEAYRRNTPFIEKNPADGMAGMFRGSLYDYDGAQRSVANLADHESKARTSAYIADLQNSNLFKYAHSGADDDNIGMARYDIQNGGDGLKYGKDAAAAAKIMADHEEAARVDANAEGANIEKNNDRMFRRTHDAYKISRAGNQTYGSPEAFQQWLKIGNFDHIDWSKAFDGELQNAMPAEQTKRLDSIFQQFVSGTHLNWAENPSSAARGFGNISTKMSAQRELVWDDPKYDIAYNRAFGSGTSIAESVHNSLASAGKTIGIMREWGPNPEMNLRRFHNDWMKELDTAGRGADAGKLDKTFNSEMNNTWNILTKPSAHPSNNFAQALAVVRQTTNTAAIGMSIFSNMGDIALRVSQMAQAGDGGVFKNLASETAHMVSGIGLDKEAQRRLAAEAGIRLEAAHLPLDPNGVANIGSRTMSKFNQYAMSLSGHAPWSNRTRLNSIGANAYRFGGVMAQDYADIGDAKQMLFRKFGINEKEFNVLKTVPLSDLGNGNKGLLTTDILAHDPKNFATLAGAATEAAQVRARSAVAASYRNMLGELADRSTSASSIANQAGMQMGRIEANTVVGELWRGAMQLKGFAFNYMKNHLGRELYGYAQNKMSFPEAMKTMITASTPGGAMARAGLAKLLAIGVGIAIVSNTLRDVASGKSVEDPFGDHWGDVISRAFARQSLGLYSDFVMSAAMPDEGGQNDSLFDKAGQMMGPEFGFASDAYTDLHRLENHVAGDIEGKDESDNFYKDAQRVGQTLYRNTPGTSLFWTKYAMDYMVLNNFSEELNPGYQQRLQDRAMKSRGQTYPLGVAP